MIKSIETIYDDLVNILKYRERTKNLDFYVSALTEYNPFYATAEIVDWLQSLNTAEYFQVTPVSLSRLNQWSFETETGDLVHASKKFFGIRGLAVKTNKGPVAEWSQPIIDQPEIGILGILTQKINGILYFLVQAKAEPGNVNTFQLSPTVQATRSNYTRVHGGKETPFLDYFVNPDCSWTLIDQLQSEQGARFFHKRNRNIIIRVPDDRNIVPPSPLFRWLTLGQLLRLARLDNVVNMDTRSVISNISYDPEYKTSCKPIDKTQLLHCLRSHSLVTSPVSELAAEWMASFHSNSQTLLNSDEILCHISREKFKTELTSRLVPLNSIQGWVITKADIHHVERKFFSVMGVRVQTTQREVADWDQPIIQQKDPGVVGFILKEIEGTLHVLVQLKMECGNMDLLELAPTVQCITGSYLGGQFPPYVEDLLESKRMTIVSDVMQSEEGGRFYRESNRNLFALADERFPVEHESQYLWMTLSQVKEFIRVNNFFNIESRSLLSQLSMV